LAVGATVQNKRGNLEEYKVMQLLQWLLKAITLAGCLMAAIAMPARAEEVVDLGGAFGGGRALLNKPAGKPRVGLVLLSGSDGYVGIGQDGSVARQGNWIVRTRGTYSGSGIASLLLDGGADVGQAIAYMRGIAPKVVVVAMSRGSLKVPSSLGSRPDGIVLASSMLSLLQSSIGSPDSLPPTLVIHPRQDSCRVTLASEVEPFQAWAGQRVRTVWIDGGTSRGDPCQAQAYHGFIGREGAVVSSIASFANTLR
jgi:hypothetical protein